MCGSIAFLRCSFLSGSDAKVQHDAPPNVLNCIVTYPNVSKCIKLYYSVS